MSVIAHLRIPANSFELGRILDLEARATIRLETLIPLGERAVPFFSVENEGRADFQEQVENHPSVESITMVNEHGNKTLYGLDWDVSRDLFLQGVLEADAHLLNGKGTAETWVFELRFPGHDRLSEFQEYCSDAQIPLDVGRIYNPTRPDAGMWFGLSDPQRTTLVRAVRGGYYSTPRRMSTKDLADELGISDQAVTERLRRAIIALVENTIIAELEGNREFEEAL